MRVGTPAACRPGSAEGNRAGGEQKVKCLRIHEESLHHILALLAVAVDARPRRCREASARPTPAQRPQLRMPHMALSIGVVDTMFARINMGEIVETALREAPGH